VSILIDENMAVSPPDMEQGRPLDLIADGQWHLYQWDLAEPEHWTTFQDVPGNGRIDGPVTTIDAIYITSETSQDAEIYLDTVYYRPDGPVDTTILPSTRPTEGKASIEVTNEEVPVHHAVVPSPKQSNAD
jgi:hypothetical protein